MAIFQGVMAALTIAFYGRLAWLLFTNKTFRSLLGAVLAWVAFDPPHAHAKFKSGPHLCTWRGKCPDVYTLDCGCTVRVTMRDGEVIAEWEAELLHQCETRS